MSDHEGLWNEEKQECQQPEGNMRCSGFNGSSIKFGNNNHQYLGQKQIADSQLFSKLSTACKVSGFNGGELSAGDGCQDLVAPFL
jgi:hypothetical protein